MVVDYKMGGINFSSQNNSGIPVDFYQAIVNDVTSETIYNETFASNYTAISGLFQGSVCLPYNITVQVHNSFGFSVSSYIVESNEPNGKRINFIF